MKEKYNVTKTCNVVYFCVKTAGISVFLFYSLFKAVNIFGFGGLPMEIHIPTKEEIAEEVRKELQNKDPEDVRWMTPEEREKIEV